MPDRPHGTFDLLAVCTFGLEAVVARELEQLGYVSKGVSTGRVLFTGDHRAIVDANLWLRSADRVLIRLASFPVSGGDEGFEMLFQGVKAIAWEDWIGRDAAFPVAGRCVRSKITSEPAAQRTTKKAIVERLQRAYARGIGVSGLAKLPETGPTVQVEVSILNDVATLTIDTSGVGLHKRGYREGSPGEAALKETLAAGLVQLSVWRPGRPLVDPFCGSGTIAIEAAMIGRNIAPGLDRGFDAERWIAGADSDKRLIDPELWLDAREDARAQAIPDRLDPLIHASDISDEALTIARANAREAGVENDIQFLRRDFADLSTTKDFGVVVTNPPYGVRLGDERELDRLYARMPVVFRKLPTWTFHIFTGRLDLETLFGQPASRRRKMYNSKIECCLFTYLGPKPPNLGESSAPRETSAPELGADDHDVLGTDAPASEPSHSAEAEAAAIADDEAEHPHPEASHPEPPATVAHPAAATLKKPGLPPQPTFGGLRERDLREAEDFGRCLSNNLRHLRKYPSRGIHCYRVYERDVPDVPLIIDRYEDRYHVAEYEREHSRTPAQQADWFDLMRRAIADAAQVPVANVYMKEKHRQVGLTQHEKVGESKHTFVVSEGQTDGFPSLKFEVNLSDYIDTGLFLDHRLTRQMVRDQAKNKRFLNLFCYTGSFTVYAAAGGAASTTSVDLSNTYLSWAQRNLALNGLNQTGNHRFVRSDVLEFLTTHPRPGAQGAYDLVVVDPPTFSNSKSTQRDWEVASMHTDLMCALHPLLSSEAVVYFSTNNRRFHLDEAGLAATGFRIQEISRKTVPPEYRNQRIHRCWRLTLGNSANSGDSSQSRET
jgi:23S rRNA (guanine2445-N2)-methyltransferase / 23S rRNA (guanine2069-N7)-methyltransferase